MVKLLPKIGQPSNFPLNTLLVHQIQVNLVYKHKTSRYRFYNFKNNIFAHFRSLINMLEYCNQNRTAYKVLMKM